jgi:hypothetical protein
MRRFREKVFAARRNHDVAARRRRVGRRGHPNRRRRDLGAHKLHGDFRSRRLKNTGDELRHQDSRLRQILLGACRRFGLVVVGYSGRDDSVMETLTDTLQERAEPFRPECSGCTAAMARRCPVWGIS